MWLVMLFADDEQMACILRVDLSLTAKRGRRVSGAQRQMLKDFLLEGTALADRVEVAVFTVGVDHSVRIDQSSVDTPLEAIRVIRDAGYRAVRISRAALRVGVLESPLDGQIWAELCDEELLRT